MSYIAIVDYGVGNLKSVTNAMKYLGLEARITSDAGEVERAGAVWVRFPMQRKSCVLPAWTGHWFLRRGKSLFWASVWGCSFFLTGERRCVPVKGLALSMAMWGGF